MASRYEMQMVKPLREPLEMDSSHFSTFELSLLQTANNTANDSPVELSELHLEMRSQSYSPSHSVDRTTEDMRSRSYSPTHSADRNPNGQYTTADDQNHHTPQTVAQTFTCTGCDKKFTSKKNLARHMKLHLNERRYECTFCNKRFNRPDYLKKHFKLHLVESWSSRVKTEL
jgi:uncharacterized Zn-finger protein